MEYIVELGFGLYKETAFKIRKESTQGQVTKMLDFMQLKSNVIYHQDPEWYIRF